MEVVFRLQVTGYDKEVHTRGECGTYHLIQPEGVQ